MSIWIILVVAVSLSMDAFSLALAYGTLNLENKCIKKLSTIVGIYHFMMPLIGFLIGSFILKILPMNPNFIVFIVLFFIGCQMVLESFKEEELAQKMTDLEMLLFGLAVSIDSFSVGIGLKMLTSHYLLSATLFALTSFLFTFLGLHLGKKVHQKLGKAATLIGGVVLIILGIFYLI